MTKKLIIFFSVLCIFFITNNSYANSQGYRDELPELKRLTDLSIGIRRINKGLKFEAKGKYKKANKMYNEAIDFLLKANKRQNIDSDIFFYLGFAYNKLKDLNNAEIYYTLGLTIDPTNIYINRNLGMLYLDSKRINLAKERLKSLENCNCEQYLDLKNFVLNYKF
tara:strand:+ start:87 stop:584 length:498 start_codon:yes stop_codon:yes gene_type:complete